MKHRKLDTTPEISKRMSNVALKGGESEVLLAKALWHSGIRYRKNYKNIPGSPDIALTRYKIAIFVDGEFWHGYDWSTKKDSLKNNRDYWIEKIEENISRDRRNDELLKEMGWIPIHFWEKQVKNNLEECVNRVVDTIQVEHAKNVIL